MRKRAIIAGITGQDGAYLTRLLLKNGYEVCGLVRSIEKANQSRLKYLGIDAGVQLIEANLLDVDCVRKIISQFDDAEFYNLAAQSSVGYSFYDPINTINFNINSVLNIVEAIRLTGKNIRFYQASSSEMYGKIDHLPITEKSIFHPVSPYAISKIAGHNITINYRESYNLFACCGILFNHESYLRDESFFVKKVIHGALKIRNGMSECLHLGNLDLKRDFGWAEKYVEAMWLMLQQEVASDYIICSGKSVRLLDIVHFVFRTVGIDTDRIQVDPALYRPNEILDIWGSSEKAKRMLNWEYDLDFFEVLENIIAEEERNLWKNKN
jgi:GDPmannose 4,6-dehydratase